MTVDLIAASFAGSQPKALCTRQAVAVLLSSWGVALDMGAA